MSAPQDYSLAEELERIGDDPVNNVHLKPLCLIPAVPENGFLCSLGKASPVTELRGAVCNKLGVPFEALNLSHAGRDLDDTLTLRDNGIVEPGAAARRSGKRIELVFSLPAGIEVPKARQEREMGERLAAEQLAQAQNEMKSVENQQNEAKKFLEDKERREARDRQRTATAAAAAQAAAYRAVQPAVAAQPAVPAQPAQGGILGGGAHGPPPVNEIQAAAMQQAALHQAALRQLPAAAGPGVGAGAGAAAGVGAGGAVVGGRAEACVVRCTPIGGQQEGDAALMLNTRLSMRVYEVARQLQAQLGTAEGDSLILVHNGHELAGRVTLRDVGIENGSEVNYYFGMEGADVVMGAGEDVPAAAAAAAFAQDGGIGRAGAGGHDALAEAAGLNGQGAGTQAQANAPAGEIDEEVRIAERENEPANEAAGTAGVGAQMGVAGPLGGNVPGSRHLSLKDSLENPEMRQCLEELRAALLEPPPLVTLEREKTTDGMTGAEIVALLVQYVPDLNDRVVPSNNDQPLRQLIVSAYRNGFPNVPQPARELLASYIRRSLAMIRNGKKEGTISISRVRALCLRLVDAFEASPAKQTRMFSALLGELIEASRFNDSPAFVREIRAWIAELREQALDHLVMRQHPGALQDHIAPEQQLAQLVEQYRQQVDSAAADPNIRNIFGELFTVGDLIAAFMTDVNQPGEEIDRRIDQNDIRQWASEHNQIGNRIYNDDGQPFLSPQLAVEILHAVLVPKAEVPSIKE